MTGPLIYKTNKRREILIGMFKLLNDTGRSKKKDGALVIMKPKAAPCHRTCCKKCWDQRQNAKVCGSSLGVFSSLRFCRSLLLHLTEKGSAALKIRSRFPFSTFSTISIFTPANPPAHCTFREKSGKMDKDGKGIPLFPW